MNKITSIKGINDILPAEMAIWEFIEGSAKRIFRDFGYSEIRIPIIEATELFLRGIGETTDIVQKEMYTFPDRSGKMLTLRPEGTASVVRAFIEHRLYQLSPTTKLFYMGPMFRHERPQAGRFRQFYQIGAEALGTSEPLIDVEVLFLLHSFFEEIGIEDRVLEINSLGCRVCRPAYRKALSDFLEPRISGFCEDCVRRFSTNPLRILDCKREGCRSASIDTPATIDFLCPECRSHFSEVRSGLDRLNLPYKINNRLVRGLDYYTKTSFEMTTTRLGAQNTIAAGGRYDGLVEDLGGPPIPGIGFAIGMERVASLFDTFRAETIKASNRSDLFIVTLDKDARDMAIPIIFELRKKGIKTEIDYEKNSLKSQMRRADKLGIRYVVIIGEDEIKKGKAVLRDMKNKTQSEIEISTLADSLIATISRKT
jgi:histidyl-tRNA synthetase